MPNSITKQIGNEKLYTGNFFITQSYSELLEFENIDFTLTRPLQYYNLIRIYSHGSQGILTSILSFRAHCHGSRIPAEHITGVNATKSRTRAPSHLEFPCVLSPLLLILQSQMQRFL